MTGAFRKFTCPVPAPTGGAAAEGQTLRRPPMSGAEQSRDAGVRALRIGTAGRDGTPRVSSAPSTRGATGGPGIPRRGRGTVIRRSPGASRLVLNRSRAFGVRCLSALPAPLLAGPGTRELRTAQRCPAAAAVTAPTDFARDSGMCEPQIPPSTSPAAPSCE